MGEGPSKLQPLKAWVSCVVQSIGGSSTAMAYRFSTSGHSLGAVVADLTGLEIASRGLSLVGSTTFENPGSEKAIQAVLDKRGFSGEIDSGHLAKLRQCYTVYNAKPNLINTTQPQFADHCNLVLPPKHSNEKSTTPPQISWHPGLWSFGQYLYGMVGSAVNTCTGYLGFNHLVQLKEDHGLRNFQALEKAVVIPVSQWHSGWNWNAPLLVKSVSLKLFKTVSTHLPSGNDLFFQEDDSDLSLVKIKGANFRDVQAVVAHQKKSEVTTVQDSRSGAYTAAISLKHHLQEATDLGYECDFPLHSNSAINEKHRLSKFQESYSEAALREHISALSYQPVPQQQQTIGSPTDHYLQSCTAACRQHEKCSPLVGQSSCC